MTLKEKLEAKLAKKSEEKKEVKSAIKRRSLGTKENLASTGLHPER